MYAMNLKLKGRRCIVVGGGQVAFRKVKPLLLEEAVVEVVAPRLHAGLQQLAADGRLCWRAATYRPGCLEGAFLVFCVTDDPAVNRTAAAEARQRGALVNVAAPAQDSDFQVPACIRRGDFQLAVSTGGSSPAFARVLRQRLEARFSDAYGEWLQRLGVLRAELQRRPGTGRERERFWRQVLDDELLALVEQGRLEEAEAKVRNAINGFGTQS